MTRFNRMCAVGLLAVGGLAGLASAAGIPNGGFEGGLTGADWQWSQASVVTNLTRMNAQGTIAPMEGSFFAYVESVPNGMGYLAATSIPVSAGSDSLQFQWIYFTDETAVSNNDYFQVLVVPSGAAGSSQTTLIANSLTGSLVPDGPMTSGNTGGYDRYTGWQSTNINLSPFVGKTVNVYFQVYQAGTNAAPSGFALDAVQSVPEPAAMSLLALGGMALVRRRRR